MMRSYTVRLRPTSKQRVVLAALLGHLCELYNACLQERREAWKVCQKRISYRDQQAELTQLRAVDPESASFPALIQRDPLRRVDRAFAGFFRRVKAKQAPGYPRFRSPQRYDSFTLDAQSFEIEGNVALITRLGGFRFHTRCRLTPPDEPTDVPAIQECEVHSQFFASWQLCPPGPIGPEWLGHYRLTCSDKSRILQHDEQAPPKFWCHKVSRDA